MVDGTADWALPSLEEASLQHRAAIEAAAPKLTPQTLSEAQRHFDHVKVTCTPTLIDLKEPGYDVKILGVNNER